MMIWIILLAMTAAAVMAVLWPLSRHARRGRTGRSEHAVLSGAARRDRAGPRARRAFARRRPRLPGRSRPTAPAGDQSAGDRLRRRRTGPSPPPSGLDPGPLGGADPGTGGLWRTRIAAHRGAESCRDGAGSASDLGAAIGQIEAHLAKNPQDGRGWEVIAPVYLRMGRMDDAIKAYEAALRHLGPNAARLADYGEALVIAKDGLVSREAQVAFEKAVAARSVLREGPALSRPRHRTGRPDRQGAGGLCSNPDRPRRAMLPGCRWSANKSRASITCREAPPGPTDNDAIAGMVASLAARLESQGGSADEWARLIRSYSVLGQRDKALATAVKARHALAGKLPACRHLDAMARELQLTDANP